VPRPGELDAGGIDDLVCGPQDDAERAAVETRQSKG
jgi:hypothetical protein